jgi:hypothetical protein
MIYKWVDDSPLRKKADASTVAHEIMAIGGASVRPKDLVQAAYLRKSSELHKCFEWDNAIAAIEYRKAQAKEILFSLVKVESTAHGEKEVLAFVESGSIQKPPEVVQFTIEDERPYRQRETKKPQEGAAVPHGATKQAKSVSIVAAPVLEPLAEEAGAPAEMSAPSIESLIEQLSSVTDELEMRDGYRDIGEKLNAIVAELEARLAHGATQAAVA